MRDPNSPETIAVGAVDAPRGSTLYEMMRRQHQAKRAAAPSSRKDDIARRLMQKAVQGFGTPGEGMVPFSDVPESVRQGVSGNQAPLVGWDPGQLQGDERMLLEMWRRQRMAEQAQNQKLNEDPMVITAGRG